MIIDTELLILASLVQRLRKIEGGKRIHHIVYILSCVGCDFGNYYFKYDKYGPYCDNLDATIQRLIDDGSFQKNTSTDGTFSYNYNREKGYAPPTMPPEHDMFPDLGAKMNLVYFLNGMSPHVLSLLANMYYFKFAKEYESDELIKKKVEIMLPNLKNYIEPAYLLFNEIQSGKIV